MFIGVFIGWNIYKFKVQSQKSKVKSPSLKFNILHLTLFISWLMILITNFFGFSTTTINLYFYLIPAFLILLFRQTEYNNQPLDGELQFGKINDRQKILLIIPFFILIFGFYFVINYFLADFYYTKAENYEKLQDYKTAALYYAKALNLRKEHIYQNKLSQSLTNQAVVMVSSSSKTDNLKEINQLVKLADDYNLLSLSGSSYNVFYWKTRASNYSMFYQLSLDIKYLDTSLQAINQAIKLASTDPRLFYSKSILLSLFLQNEKDLIKIKNYQKQIISQLNEAISLKKNYRDAYFAKGTFLNQFGEREEAKNYFDYILKNLNPNDEEAKKESDKLK
ncbi:MAG: hypothetical protein ACD_12C00447G0001 [uncultured bacterium]|nr:MAG: hypothetical protein ACD_12C00447G0001 [uncultured bacterium]